MDSMDDADILHPTPERINFYRLTTLLIVGGTEIMRQEFDRIHPSRTLTADLAAVRSTIQRAARLTRTQMDSLYPPTGNPAVRSRDFDITLLFALLRNICHLPAPATGWDVLPPDLDDTLQADLARIKYYRNELYAHVSGGMEVRAVEFDQLWRVIRCALLRIVGKNDAHKMMEWKRHIDRLEKEPLEPPNQLDLLIEKLEEWHKAEKEEIRQLSRSVSDIAQGTEALNISMQDMQDNTNKLIAEQSKTRMSVEKNLETLQDSVLQLAPKETTGTEAGSGVSAGQMGTGSFIFNNCVFNQTTTKQQLTTRPALHAIELPGVPSAGQPASPPTQPRTDSTGASPFSRQSSRFEFEENLQEPGTSFSSGEFSANTSSSFTSPPSGPSPTYNSWSWSGDDTSTSVSNEPRYSTRSSTPIDSVRPSISPRFDTTGHCTFPLTTQSLASQEYDSTSIGTRSRTTPYNPVSSVSAPTLPQSNAAGYGSSQYPAWQAHGPTSSGATPSTALSTFAQSDATENAMTSLSRSVSSNDAFSPWHEYDYFLAGARSQDDITRHMGGDFSNSTKYSSQLHNNMPSQTRDAIQRQDRDTQARREPPVLSYFGGGCSARTDGIPQSTEEFGRDYLSIVIRCCKTEKPFASAVIDRIANASIRPSTESAQGSQSQFQRYLEDSKCLRVINCQVAADQCTILVQPLLLSALEELWKEYKAGDLRVIVQESLVTPEVLKGVTDYAYLEVEIDEKQYELCNLMMDSHGPTQRCHTSSFIDGTPVASTPPSRPKSMPVLTTESCSTSAARELYNIICENGGSMELRAALNQLRLLSLQSYAVINNLGEQRFLRKHDDLFCRQSNGAMVESVLPITFCTKISNPGGCESQCPDLHLCPFNLLGSCERTSSDCSRSHDPNDHHTLRILGNRCGLGHLTTTQRRCLLKKLASDKKSEWRRPRNTVPDICIFYNSKGCDKGDTCPFLHVSDRKSEWTRPRNTVPEICTFYNTIKGCSKGDTCTRLHVCRYWVHNKCKFADVCKRNHDFDSQHNKGILKDRVHGLTDLEVLGLLQGEN